MKRATTKRAARLDFAALEIIGALLTPDMVARIAAFDAADQSTESYGIQPGLKLRDEIARYFRIGEALWSKFEAATAGNPAASEQFMLDLLSQCFGFSTLAPQATVAMGEREFPIRHSALGGRVPVVIAPQASVDARRPGIDESLTQFADGNRRRSATLLLQEFLNAEDKSLWGIAADGRTLRLMRDNLSLTRPAWIEADLARIFTEGLFADFTALWLLIHQSRFGLSDAAVSDCPLEHWRERGRTEGVAARDKLRQGVEAAVAELGQGFLEHPDNAALRQDLNDGALTPQGYFEELLRLVYRLIFLFAAEDRDLLHPPETTEVVRSIYNQGYSLSRLRERSVRRTSRDRHIDAWDGLKATLKALSVGEQQLGLAALGGLFARGQTQHLTASRVENHRFLEAIWRLAWLRPDGQPLTRVNWRDMETEELGSVYESLLELTPRASADARTFTFAEGLETQGNARKTSGSYYTPDALVKLLLDSTLDPVLDAAEARNPTDPAGEILKLSIIDPACGSGHFLLGAARRAAARIAKLRSPGAPSKAEFQHALREVVSHCIYGVDRNPMAVELCKVALWIEALEPGKPLTYLNARIRCGDSLIGVFDYNMLKQGIPDEAYKPLTGDNKKTAAAYKKHNKQMRDGDTTGELFDIFEPPADLIDADRALAAMPEENLDQISAKDQVFKRLHSGDNWLNRKIACDLYVAAFFATKTGPEPGREELARPTIPLTDHVWTAARGKTPFNPLIAEADRIAYRVSAFHWPLEFPHIFDRGGFDAVIGNPPWERIKLQEKEFFASRSPQISQAANKAERNKLIKALAKAEPGSPQARLLADFQAAKHDAEAASEFARNSGRFPLTGAGDVNTYALFAEHFARLARGQGRSGVIVPTGIATDSSTSAFFGDLVKWQRLSKLIDFENREKMFPSVDSRMRYCILALGTSDLPKFVFFLTNIAQFDETERHVTLTSEQIAHFNPNTKTSPIFRSHADAKLTAKLYDRAPVLIEERTEGQGGNLNPWGINFQRMFDMSTDSSLFSNAPRLEAENWDRDGTDWVREVSGDLERHVPLYEAKMIHHYDHRWATYGSTGGRSDTSDATTQEKSDTTFEPKPRYWVPEEEVIQRAARIPVSLTKAWRKSNPNHCLKALAEWLTGAIPALEGRPLTEDDLSRIFGRQIAWRAALGKTPERWLLEPKTHTTGTAAQAAMPLNTEDIRFLTDGPADPLDLAAALIERKQPRWLMGWRDITNATNERTVIASIFPKVGTSDTLLLKYPVVRNAKFCAALNASLCSIPLDYICRQKIGGTHLKYNVFKQNAVLPPSAYSEADLAFITPRVLELTYTSHSMRPWAEDLGYTGAPFGWDEDRRALLRAELDQFFGKKYGLSRDEMQYILDPAKAKGPDYPSETFRVLKNKELKNYGEYRTERLLLEAWDRLSLPGDVARVEPHTAEVIALPTAPPPLRLPDLVPIKDGAWARAGSDGEVGGMLTAILKAMSNAMPISRVRLAALLALETDLLLPHLDTDHAAHWTRLTGTQPTTSFDETATQWGESVRHLRANGMMTEDLNAETWAPGKGLSDIPTDGWPDGRALMVLVALRRIGDSAVIQSLLQHTLERWEYAEAAA